MSDHLVPPPEEPLDPAARARLRQRVMAGAHAPAPRGRWAVPVSAAAAVALVAVMATVIGIGPTDESGDGEPAGPGSVTTTSAVPTPSTIPPEPAPTSEPPLVLPEEGGTTVYDPESGEFFPPLPEFEPEPATCAGELRHVLRGAEPVVEIEGEASTGTFHVRDGRWAQCTVGPEAVTVAGDRPIDATFAEDDTTPWQVSTDIADLTRRSTIKLFVAGGPLPPGVTGIDYRFPDGAVRRAEVAVDDDGRSWWRMEHAPTSGVLTDPRQNSLELAPIEVTVSLSGRRYSVLLDWGTDTCAQRNHGC